MIITEHAKLRYAERIMDKVKNDAKSFISQNNEKIEEWINKLFEYSECLYTGRIREHAEANFYVNRDGWVLIVDKEKNVIITLYKIDLGLGSEFNKEYINRMVEKIKEESDKLLQEELSLEEYQQLRLNQTKDNNDEIEFLKSKISHLKNHNILLSQESVVKNSDFQLRLKDFNKLIENFINSRVCE